MGEGRLAAEGGRPSKARHAVRGAGVVHQVSACGPTLRWPCSYELIRWDGCAAESSGVAGKKERALRVLEHLLCDRGLFCARAPIHHNDSLVVGPRDALANTQRVKTMAMREVSTCLFRAPSAYPLQAGERYLIRAEFARTWLRRKLAQLGWVPLDSSADSWRFHFTHGNRFAHLARASLASCGLVVSTEYAASASARKEVLLLTVIVENPEVEHLSFLDKYQEASRLRGRKAMLLPTRETVTIERVMTREEAFAKAGRASHEVLREPDSPESCSRIFQADCGLDVSQEEVFAHVTCASRQESMRVVPMCALASFSHCPTRVPPGLYADVQAAFRFAVKQVLRESGMLQPMDNGNGVVVVAGTDMSTEMDFRDASALRVRERKWNLVPTPAEVEAMARLERASDPALAIEYWPEHSDVGSDDMSTSATADAAAADAAAAAAEDGKSMSGERTNAIDVTGHSGRRRSGRSKCGKSKTRSRGGGSGGGLGASKGRAWPAAVVPPSQPVGARAMRGNASLRKRRAASQLGASLDDIALPSGVEMPKRRRIVGKAPTMETAPGGEEATVKPAEEAAAAAAVLEKKRNLRTLTCAQLREMLRRNGSKTAGHKADLIARVERLLGRNRTSLAA